MSLRGRVLAYLAVAAIASCTLTVGFGVVLVRHHIADQQFTVLRNQVGLLATVSGHPVAQSAGTHVFRTDSKVPHSARRGFARAVIRSVDAGAGVQGTIDLRGRTYLYVDRDTALGRIILVRRAAVHFAQVEPFLEAFGLAGIAGCLLALLLGVVLARRLTRPIASLAAATHRLADGEVGVAVPVDGDDELADLGRSFNAMSAELQRTREQQQTFLESVSHELKTPLTSVRGYAEGLADGALAPDEAGRVIVAEAGRLQRLVADLLDLARLGRSDFSVDREPVDLTAVAAAAVTRHGVRARELGVALIQQDRRGGSGPGIVLADEGRLLQACSNLIENALRLTPPDGQVVVSCDGGELSVCDDGPGLEQSDLSRAFERFYLYDRYRADPGRATGSGLGLAIVARLITAMGGTVRAENRAAGGACFTISLPAAPAGVDPDAARSRV